MFNQLGNMLGQFQMVQKLMKDENFRALIKNSKVREVFMDPEFQKLVQGNNIAKLPTHPKFASLMSDPEVMQLLSKLNPQDFRAS